MKTSASTTGTHRDVILLVDSSASLRGPTWNQLERAVDQILAALGPSDRVMLKAGDLSLRRNSEGILSASSAATLKIFLASLRPAGDRREIVALSEEFGIMCRYTSWLVLENEEAYKRHQIERRKRRQLLAAD